MSSDDTAAAPIAHHLLRVPALVHGRVLVREPQAWTRMPGADEPTVPLFVGDGVKAGDTLAEAPAPLLLAFHGYGEDALAVLAAVNRIPGIERWRIAAPQALHPFYTKTGEVVASWMTRLDREQAIADNVGYVGQTIAALAEAHGRPPQIAFAGFSQGVAMTWRAAVRSGWRAAGVVALAGDVPADVVRELPAGLPVLLGRGSGDTWYSAAKMSADVIALAAGGCRAEALTFVGGHEWGEAFLAAAGRFLAGLTAAAG